MSDNVQVALIVSGVPGIVQLITYFLQKKKLDDVHKDVNGGLAKMREVELRAERVLGIAEGRALEKLESPK